MVERSNLDEKCTAPIMKQLGFLLIILKVTVYEFHFSIRHIGNKSLIIEFAISSADCKSEGNVQNINFQQEKDLKIFFAIISWHYSGNYSRGAITIQ